MKIISVYMFLVLFTVSGCKDDPDPIGACGVGSPVEDLDWLGAEINKMDTSSLSIYQYVQQAQFYSQTVFVFGNCCPYCQSIFPVYDCSGTRIGYLGQGPGGVDVSALTDTRIVWKTDNSECSFNN